MNDDEMNEMDGMNDDGIDDKDLLQEMNNEPEPEDHEPMDNPMDKDGPKSGPAF